MNTEETPAIPQPVQDVYEVFKDFFGEEYVDLQGNSPYDILVYWPEVVVTNEHNRSVTIQDLFAKVTIDSHGRIPWENQGFLLNRATYPAKQFRSDYMHSHVCSIPKKEFHKFQLCCLGRGPIKETIHTLKSEFDTVMWMLFCQELSLYVQTESIHGVPYHYLERIGDVSSDMHEVYDRLGAIAAFKEVLSPTRIKEFIELYLNSKEVCFSFYNGCFQQGQLPYEYLITLSNAFIDYCNELSILPQYRDLPERLFSKEILLNVKIKNRRFYTGSANIAPNLAPYRDKFVCTFKGREFKTTIIDDSSQDNPFPVTILDPAIGYAIAHQLLNILNYHYGNNRQNQETSTSHQKILYI